jgi:hypothetical protein
MGTDCVHCEVKETADLRTAAESVFCCRFKCNNRARTTLLCCYSEQSRIEQSRAQQSRGKKVDQRRTEQSRIEHSKAG